MQVLFSGQHDEEKRSFGVLTVTSSTDMDSYFASKRANLQSKAEKDDSTSRAGSQVANDKSPYFSVRADEQAHLEQLSQMNLEFDPLLESDVLTAKLKKEKQRKVKHSDFDYSERQSSKSLALNGKSKKKKKKRKDDDLAEVTPEGKSSREGTKKDKLKRKTSHTSAIPELTNSEHRIRSSKKQKKLKHADCDTS